MAETIETIALLLPARDGETRAWFEKELRRNSSGNIIDVTAIDCATLSPQHRQLQHFEFWHDRLLALKMAFDEANPKTVRQLWFDRRNPENWYNWWFAVVLVIALTLFFGVVQSIEGGIQVYKAYHPS